MATNQTGIAIAIKAFLPTGKTIDEQYAALTLVKTAHETGNYSALLAAATIDEVKSEQKTRRVEPAPAAPETPSTEPAGTIGGAEIIGDDDPSSLTDEQIGAMGAKARAKKPEPAE